MRARVLSLPAKLEELERLAAGRSATLIGTDTLSPESGRRFPRQSGDQISSWRVEGSARGSLGISRDLVPHSPRRTTCFSAGLLIRGIRTVVYNFRIGPRRASVLFASVSGGRRIPLSGGRTSRCFHGCPRLCGI